MKNIITGFDDIGDWTDEQVKQWLESVLDEDPQNLGGKVAEVICKHKHKPKANETEAGVQEFVFAVMTDLRALGGTKFMKEN